MLSKNELIAITVAYEDYTDLISGKTGNPAAELWFRDLLKSGVEVIIG